MDTEPLPEHLPLNLRCLPHTFHGKNGLAVALHHLPADGGAQLIDMYLAFRPRNSFQGLPPLKDEVCVGWVQDMLRTGIHVTAGSAASRSSAIPRIPHQPAEV